MIDLNNFQSINLSQFFDTVKFRSGLESGYHLVIHFCIVTFILMLMLLMKFSFVPQTFFRIFFFFFIRIRIMTRIRISLWNSLKKFLWKSRFSSGSGSGSWFYFRFQYQTYILYTEDTHQILFGSANSFESYCVHSKSPRPDRQTYGKIFFCLFCLLRHTKHEHSSRGDDFFSLMRL